MALEVRDEEVRNMYADLAKQWRDLVCHICELEQKSAA
jgi:hypothetical protein